FERAAVCIPNALGHAQCVPADAPDTAVRIALALHALAALAERAGWAGRVVVARGAALIVFAPCVAAARGERLLARQVVAVVAGVSIGLAERAFLAAVRVRAALDEAAILAGGGHVEAPDRAHPTDACEIRV